MKKKYIECIHCPEYLFSLLIIDYYSKPSSHNHSYSDEHDMAHQLLRLLPSKYTSLEKNNSALSQLKKLCEQYICFSSGKLSDFPKDIAIALLKLTHKKLSFALKHNRLISIYLFDEELSFIDEIRNIHFYILLTLKQMIPIPFHLALTSAFNLCCDEEKPIFLIHQKEKSYTLKLIDSEKNKKLLMQPHGYAQEKKLYKKIQLSLFKHYSQLHEKIIKKKEIIKQELSLSSLSFAEKQALYFNLIELFITKSTCPFFTKPPIINTEHSAEKAIEALLDDTLAHYIAFDILPHPLKKMIFHEKPFI